MTLARTIAVMTAAGAVTLAVVWAWEGYAAAGTLMLLASFPLCG